MSNQFEGVRTIDQLNMLILEKEKDQEVLGLTIKKQALAIVEGMRPINMIKNSLSTVIDNNTKGNSIYDSPLGKGTSRLLGSLLGGISNQFIKSTLTNVLSTGILTFISMKPNMIGKLGAGILNIIKGNSGKDSQE